MLVCNNTQYVAHWLLYIACHTLNVAQHDYDTTLFDSVFHISVFIFRHNIVPSHFHLLKLTFLVLMLMIICVSKVSFFHMKQDNDDSVTSHVQWVERYTDQSDDYFRCVAWLHFAHFMHALQITFNVMQCPINASPSQRWNHAHVCKHFVRSLLESRGYMDGVDSTNVLTLIV